jgi:hypothetical protein
MDAAAIYAEWRAQVGEVDAAGHRLWRGRIDAQGYARFHGVRVQRLLWRLADPRPLPPGAQLRNLCGHPTCTVLAHWACRSHGALILRPSAL